MDHSSGLVFRRPPAALRRRAVVYFYAAVLSQALSGTEVVVTRDYTGNFEIKFPKDPTLFPDALHPNSIDSICQNLPSLTEEVGENFQLAATECAMEATQCAREGRFEKLASVRDQHVAALQEQLTEGNPEPQYSNEKPVHYGLRGEVDGGRSQAR